MVCSLAGAVREHSLFTQPLGSPALSFTPIFLSRLRQENESQYELAALQCHGSKECIYDSLSTGNLALGLATQSLAADFQQRKTALSKWSTSPPLRGHGLGVTGQCPAPFLGSLASYETEVTKVLDLHCPAGLSPVLGDATSRTVAIKVLELHFLERHFWLLSKPGRCHHAVQQKGLVGGQL